MGARSSGWAPVSGQVLWVPAMSRCGQAEGKGLSETGIQDLGVLISLLSCLALQVTAAQLTYLLWGLKRWWS